MKFGRGVSHLPRFYFFLPLTLSLDFPGSSASKGSSCYGEDPRLIPGLRRSLGGGHSNPLQYSCLENSMDRGDWQATLPGVAKSWTWLSDFHFHLFPSLSIVFALKFSGHLKLRLSQGTDQQESQIYTQSHAFKMLYCLLGEERIFPPGIEM